MWVARIKMWHAGSASIELTKQYDAHMTAYYLNAFNENGKSYINRVNVVDGRDKEVVISEFIKRESKRTKILEVVGHQIIYTISATDQYHSTIIGSRVFLVKPIEVAHGFEFWTVGAHTKQQLVDLVNRLNATKLSSAEILSVKQEKPVFQTASLAGELTGKQLRTFEMAFREGYYNYPRRTDLNKLAAKAGVSKTALRVSLRRAEKTLLESIYTHLH